MSDIIIEGKNLDDITQSNFQTVGVRSGFHFVTNPNLTEDQLDVNQSVFKYDTIDIHEARLGDNYSNYLFNLFPKELIKHVTIEPWQGRLHYDKDFINDELNTGLSFVKKYNEVEIEGDGFGGLTPAEIADLINSLASPLSPLFYSYFYTNNIYDNDQTRYKLNNFYSQLQNDNLLGVEERESNVSIVKDDRFPLGTYTEENKQYWELQTSDPVSRNSQFSSQRMQTAQSTKLSSDLIRSEEEQFSVDAFTFTERDGVVTPLFFYYDKKLHPIEYNNATTGKVNMKLELRESGRNGEGEIDLYQERKVVRPFLLGLEKDELRNGGFDLNDPPEELVGTGEIHGEGLYYADNIITIQAEPDDNSYLLGIFDIPDDNLVTLGNDSGRHTFLMPSDDVQYLAKFRPNPYIIMRQRFTDEYGNDIVGGPDSKGEIRLWQSKLNYDNDEDEHYTVPIDNTPPFKTAGSRFIENSFRPLNFNGEPITIEQREATNNYKFRGFTYLSGSDNPQEVPFPSEPIQIQTTGPAGVTVTAFADQNYEGMVYGNSGTDETGIKTIELLEDFYYPGGRLNIYANYGLILFHIENLNNNVDFENNFAEALKYGPFKFVTALGGTFNGVPDVDAYRSDNITSFPAYSPDQPNVRLYISGPGMGYVNTPTTPPIEENPIQMPDGWTPVNPLIGTLSPLGQWIWDGGFWGENPNYDPSDYQSFSDYLPSGDNAHLVSIEETGFDFGTFVWHKFSQFSGVLLDEIPIANNSYSTPNTLQTAIDIAGEFPPTYNSSGFNQQVNGSANSPSPNYDVGDTAGPGGIFIVTEVTLDQAGSEDGNYFWDIEWGPNLSEDQTFDGVLYDLNTNEFEFNGIELRGELDDDDLLTNWQINQIISTETTSSISYQPLQRGVYVKVIDDGVISTFIERSIINSMTPIRPKELSGAIDADMEGFDRSVVYNMTPSQPSMPPQISAFVAQANGDLTNSTNIHPTLDLERLGVEWNPDDWSANGGGTFKYTAPESRDATYMAGDDEISLFWKYIEFRIVVQETADGEQSESGEAVDPSFYIGLNVFGMPGSGGQIFNDETGNLVSSGGLIDLFNVEEMVDEDGIPYQEFSQIPFGERSITLRAVPSAGQFAAGDEGTWSFQADPGVNLDTVGSITEFLNSDGHHIAVVTFNEEGPVTVSYSWFGDEDGGGF